MRHKDTGETRFCSWEERSDLMVLDLLRRKEDRGGGSGLTELRRLRRRRTAAGAMTARWIPASASSVES